MADPTFEWTHDITGMTESELKQLLGQEGWPSREEQIAMDWPSSHEFRIHQWSDPFTEYIQGIISGGAGEMAKYLQGVYGSWIEGAEEEEGGGDGGEGGGGEAEAKKAWEERYGVPYPTLTLPRYQAFGAEYPVSDLPIYEPFPQAYPELKLPIYQQFPVEHPELPPLYSEAEDVIGRMLRGEGLGLPVEELMAAYTEEERLAMEEYMPELREYWSEKNLLKSGMEREAERLAVRKAAAARGTYRSNLEKESVIRQQEGIVKGLQLAMDHVGIGYGAEKDAWNAAMTEYTKVYQSEIQTGMAHFDASARAWDAAMVEYTKAFSSEVAATEFGQRIQEMAFNVARDEYQRVYQSAYSATSDEYQAQARGWEAAWREFSTFRDLLYGWSTMEAGHAFQFDFLQRQQAFQFEYLQLQQQFAEMMWYLQADLDRELAQMGYNSQERQTIWGSIGDIILGAVGLIIKFWK